MKSLETAFKFFFRRYHTPCPAARLLHCKKKLWSAVQALTCVGGLFRYVNGGVTISLSHSHSHARTRTHAHTHTSTYAHSRAHTRIHTHTSAHTHTHTHTHTHVRARMRNICLCDGDSSIWSVSNTNRRTLPNLYWNLWGHLNCSYRTTIRGTSDEDLLRPVSHLDSNSVDIFKAIDISAENCWRKINGSSY
jgi:hypothetical protein